MLPRRHTPLAAIASAVVALAASGRPAAASEVSTTAAPAYKYRLTNVSDRVLTDPIDFTIVPPGSIAAPPRIGPDGKPVLDPTTGQAITDNPLTPVDPDGFDTTTSFRAYDPSHLTVALGQDEPLTTQGLRLVFGSRIVPQANGELGLEPILGADGLPVGGLKPGSEHAIDFRLSLAPGSTTAPDLLPQPEVADLVKIEKLTEPPPSGPRPDPKPPGDDGTKIPEPFSLAVWSGLAGVGLLRARRFRRRAA